MQDSDTIKVRKFKVKSDTIEGKFYVVRYFPKTGKCTCTCPNYAYGEPGHECKHIERVRKNMTGGDN